MWVASSNQLKVLKSKTEDSKGKKFCFKIEVPAPETFQAFGLPYRLWTCQFLQSHKPVP